MRPYQQYCGLARALDVVGDRWNLLIVRELLIGPVRHRDLAAALPGLASNLLVDRLRRLEADGVVERDRVEGAKAVTYRLTDLGQGLREPVEALVRWSVPLMATGPRPDDAFRPHWMVLALESFLGPRRWDRRRTVVVDVGDAVVVVELGRSGASCQVLDDRGDPSPDVDVAVRMPAPLLLGLCSGALGVADVAPAVEVARGRVADLGILAP